MSSPIEIDLENEDLCQHRHVKTWHEGKYPAIKCMFCPEIYILSRDNDQQELTRLLSREQGRLTYYQNIISQSGPGPSKDNAERNSKIVAKKIEGITELLNQPIDDDDLTSDLWADDISPHTIGTSENSYSEETMNQGDDNHSLTIGTDGNSYSEETLNIETEENSLTIGTDGNSYSEETLTIGTEENSLTIGTDDNSYSEQSHTIGTEENSLTIGTAENSYSEETMNHHDDNQSLTIGTDEKNSLTIGTAENSYSEKTRRQKGEGSGILRRDKIRKKGKEYYQWTFHIDNWQHGTRISQTTLYVPKRLVETITRMNQERVPVAEIIEVITSSRKTSC